MTSFIRTRRRTGLLWLVAGTVVFLCTYRVADRLLDIRHGLSASYFEGSDWQPGRASSPTVDRLPSTSLLKQRRPDFLNQPFSVEWRGFIYVPRSGTYTFATVSDDGSWLYVRGREVVANGGHHGTAEKRGSIALEAGVHPLLIRYFQDGGDCALELKWAREGRPLEPLPASALLAERVSPARLLTRQATRFVEALLVVVWYVVLVSVSSTWIFRGASRLFNIRSDGVDPAFAAVLLLSVLLNIWGIWWALPNTRGWAPDELVPADVLTAFRQLFSFGWRDKYPPFHYAVIAVADSPILLLSWLGLVDLEAPTPYLALVLIGRLVALAMGALTIIVVYRSGLELYGRRGAAFAALTMALTVPFVYYAKLANLDVPYLFWFSVSLFAYIRILKRHDRRDYLVFAASATLAVCTKDQAYGLYVLTPLAILVTRWRRWRQTGGPVVQILFDGTTLRAIAVAAGIFLVADNVVFNFTGFVAHVRLLLGPVSSAYQLFPGTVAGQMEMAWFAMRELRYMFGWPLAVIVAIAVLRGVADRATTPSPRWLLVPALSYYVAFIAVVLYFYDRFLMPMGLVLSLFAGYWLEQFVAPGVWARRARLALVSAAFGYSAIYVAAVDYALTRDSRYTVTRWIQAHTKPDQVIGSLGQLEYLMLADHVPWHSVESVQDVAGVQPPFIVLNADFVAKLPAGHPMRIMHDALLDGRAGYRLAGRFRSPPLPLPGLHPDLGDRRRLTPEFSMLNMINPTMEVFERTGMRSSRE